MLLQLIHQFDMRILGRILQSGKDPVARNSADRSLPEKLLRSAAVRV